VLLEKHVRAIHTFSVCVVRHKKNKSQLQTVLITASGPQALNALVHRERYTQGSRQNRCVSSQEALALRAKVMGNREDQCPWFGAPFDVSCIGARLLCTASVTRPAMEGYLSEGRLKTLLPMAPRVSVFGLVSKRLPTQNCLRRGIQLYN